MDASTCIKTKRASHGSQFGNSADIIGRLLDALKTKKGVVDVSKIVDADNNNPVHLFVLGTSNHNRNRDEEDSEMLILLLDAGTPQQRVHIEAARNRSGLRPLDYIPGMETRAPTVRALRSNKSLYYRNILENEPAIASEWVLVFPKVLRLQD